ncbi:hypothetical protein VNO80_04764 [Phaseolus coccineus]|uniref:Phytocyanin domain-containing protein n=1 Tax=Phaseolus coccineus TaxID=3886 RepID=A0AAN9RPK3_PHACN
MALSPLTILVLIATIFLPSIAVAKDFVVGDDHGWTEGFDYSTWTADKTFQVGDVLVFKYVVGEQNVFKVNGTAFRSCTVPPANEALTTGNDRIVLTTPGRKWYICGLTGHCNAGQKLFITVQAQTLPPTLPPAPAPSPFQDGPGFDGWVPKKLLTIFH